MRFELSAPVEQDGGRRAGQPADLTFVFNVSINSNVWLKCDVFNLNMKEFKYIRCVKNLFSSPSETLNREWGGGCTFTPPECSIRVGGLLHEGRVPSSNAALILRSIRDGRFCRG